MYSDTHFPQVKIVSIFCHGYLFQQSRTSFCPQRLEFLSVVPSNTNHPAICIAPEWQLGLPCDSARKQSTCKAGDLGSIPGLGRSPGEGKGYPLQYSGLENSMDCIVHGVERVGHDWATFRYSRRWGPAQVRSQLFSHHHLLPSFLYFYFKNCGIFYSRKNSRIFFPELW